MNSIVLKVSFLLSIIALSRCVLNTQGLKNNNLRDKVAACGAGLSDEAVASLQAAYGSSLSVQGSLEFKTQEKEIIFSEIPESDRLKAYEEYIKCIESPVFSNHALVSKNRPSVNMKQK